MITLCLHCANYQGVHYFDKRFGTVEDPQHDCKVGIPEEEAIGCKKYEWDGWG